MLSREPFAGLKYAGVTLAVAGLLGWTACSPEKPVLAGGSMSKVGGPKEAPDFSLKDNDGRSMHLSDYRGKVILLDFWATWCGPCKIEIPWFEEFQRKYGERGLIVLGIAEDDGGWPVVRPFLKELNINYRVALGDDTTADQYGGIEALPTTYLIDRDGHIAETHVGLTSRKDFENAIEQLLEQAARPDHHRASGNRPGFESSGADIAKAHGL